MSLWAMHSTLALAKVKAEAVTGVSGVGGHLSDADTTLVVILEDTLLTCCLFIVLPKMLEILSCLFKILELLPMMLDMLR